MKKGTLNDEAQVWLSFVKETILPTSHTNNLEGKSVAVGKHFGARVLL